MSENPYASSPSPYERGDMSPGQERTWAMITHAGSATAMVLSAGTLGFIGALVVYLVYKDRGPFVRHYAAASLNVQLTALVILIVSVPLMLVLIGFVTYPLACAWAVVLHVIATLKANQGEWWNPPLTPRIFR